MTTLPDLDRLHAEATPGPWIHRLDARGYAAGIDAPNDRGVPGAVGTIIHGRGIGFPSSDAAKANVQLITALRNAYPALRAYVAALEAERDASRAILGRMAHRRQEGPVQHGVALLDDLKHAHLATDAAREKMEKQDG